jgi:hypothetical protein
MKISELKQIIKEEIEKVLAEGVTGAFDPEAKKGRRYIPNVITFPKSSRDYFKSYTRLLKSTDGEYKLYISGLMKLALDNATRGRVPKNHLKAQSELVKLMSDKIPQNVRSLLKKYSGNKMNTAIDMYPVNTKIKEVTAAGDIVFYNPDNTKMADLAYDNNISESK